MRKLLITLTVVIALSLTANVALASPGNVDATCSISVDVNEIMEWAGNFSAITLSPINDQNDIPEANSTVVLYTNGSVTITADQDSAAQLDLDTDPNQTLVTWYKLDDDGDGTNSTGKAAAVGYDLYNAFPSSTYTITHVAGDGAVEIDLWIKAANETGDVADVGTYEATQTLTAAWVGG